MPCDDGSGCGPFASSRFRSSARCCIFSWFIAQKVGWPHGGSNCRALIHAGDLAAAERVLQEARVRHPTPANQTLLINLLYSQGKNADAAKALEELALRHPEHPNGVLLRARMLAD